jgi:flagellar basal-body rod protein FlgB
LDLFVGDFLLMSAYEGVPVTTLLQKSMSILAERHRVISNNIANLDTPGYQPVDVDFGKTLDRALANRDVFHGKSTRGRHFGIVNQRPAVYDQTLKARSETSGVDIEYEMGELTKNTGAYTIYSSLLKKRFQMVANMLRNMR